MRLKVLSGNGVPSVDVFRGFDGTPLYIDLDTGFTYFLNDANQVIRMGAVVESRTSDPDAPTVGQIWLRTDL